MMLAPSESSLDASDSLIRDMEIYESGRGAKHNMQSEGRRRWKIGQVVERKTRDGSGYDDLTLPGDYSSANSAMI
jgi:hypothetical protein